MADLPLPQIREKKFRQQEINLDQFTDEELCTKNRLGRESIQYLVEILKNATGYSSSPCPSTLQINLQNNLGLLVSWFCKNFLAINHSKSQSIVFNRATLSTPFVIDSNELDYVPQIKLLGVIIDNSLSFKAHIKEIFPESEHKSFNSSSHL